MGELRSGEEMKAYWEEKIKKHKKILKASGEIKERHKKY